MARTGGGLERSMCGIAGYVGSAGAARPDGAIAGAMADLIRHRGPDDEGAWADPEAGLSFSYLSNCRSDEPFHSRRMDRISNLAHAALVEV